MVPFHTIGRCVTRCGVTPQDPRQVPPAPAPRCPRAAPPRGAGEGRPPRCAALRLGTGFGGAPPASPPAIPPRPLSASYSSPSPLRAPAFSQILSPSPVKVFSLPPSLISILTAGGGRCISSPSAEIVLEKNKIKRKTKAASLCPRPPGRRGAPDPSCPDQFIPVLPSRRYREGIYLGHQPAPHGHPMPAPIPYIAPMEREVCPQQGSCRCLPGGGLCPEAPMSPPPRGAAGPGVPVRRGPPQPSGPLPGGCSPPEGGGERQAGAEAGLGRPPPLALRLPPPGGVPPAPRPAGGSAPPGEAGPGLQPRGRTGFEGPLAERHPPSHTTPLKTCRAIAPRGRGSPPKANGGCVGDIPLPERWPGGAPESGGAGSGSFPPAVSRSRNFPRAGPVRGSRAAPGGTPRPGRAAHPGPCLYVERRVI